MPDLAALGKWLTDSGCPPSLAVMLAVASIVVLIRKVWLSTRPTHTESLVEQVTMALVNRVAVGNGDREAPTISNAMRKIAELASSHDAAVLQLQEEFRQRDSAQEGRIDTLQNSLHALTEKTQEGFQAVTDLQDSVISLASTTDTQIASLDRTMQSLRRSMLNHTLPDPAVDGATGSKE